MRVDAGTLRVVADVLCIQCNYNLRTMSLEGRCPECACPVVDSLHGDGLHPADVRTLRRLRAGVVCLAIAMVLLSAAHSLVFYYVTFDFEFMAGAPWYVGRMALGSLFWPAVALVGSGAFLGTSATWQESPLRVTLFLRRGTRFCAVVCVIALAGANLPKSWFGTFTSGHEWFEIVGAIALYSSIVLAYFFCRRIILGKELRGAVPIAAVCIAMNIIGVLVVGDVPIGHWLSSMSLGIVGILPGLMVLLGVSVSCLRRISAAIRSS